MSDQANADTNFIALTPLWHTKEKREYPIGAEVNLSHLSEEQREALVDEHIVAPLSIVKTFEAIKGVGHEYARVLVGVGIVSLEQLIATQAGEVERRAPALSVAQVSDWQRQARDLTGAVDNTSVRAPDATRAAADEAATKKATRNKKGDPKK